MVRPECVSFFDQVSAFKRANKFIVKTLFLKLASCHLFAHFGDAAIKRQCHACLNAPVITALIGACDAVVAEIERRDVKGRSIA